MMITYEDMQALTRPFSTDRSIVGVMIGEAEREDIRTRIGDGLFLLLSQEGEPKGPVSREVTLDGVKDDRMACLLDGCVWTDGCGHRRMHYGLRMAVAYFAYARVLRDGNIQATRYGAVNKDGNYSSKAEIDEKHRQYNEAFAQAEGYLSDTLAYLNCNRDRYPEYHGRGRMRSNRSSVRIIGK